MKSLVKTDANERQSRPAKWYVLTGIALSLMLAASLILRSVPGGVGLTALMFYAIPSHMLVSVFPIEPIVLLFAASHQPILVVALATLGCVIAGLLDYGILRPMLLQQRLRSKYENSKFFQKAVHLFKKSPFWILAAAGFSPTPFYPFKFISISSGYPLWKYQLATIAGRAPKYYTIAILGYILKPPLWIFFLMAALPLAIFVFNKLRSWLTYRLAVKKVAIPASSLRD